MMLILGVLVCVICAQTFLLVVLTKRSRIRIESAPPDVVSAIQALADSHRDTVGVQQESITRIEQALAAQDTNSHDRLNQVAQLFGQAHAKQIEFARGHGEQYHALADYIRKGHDQTATQLAAMNEFVNDTKRNLRRFQDGYDLKILKDFLKPIFRLMEENQAEENEAVDNVLRDLEVLLENHGVDSFTPERGTRLDDMEGRFEVVDTEHTVDAGLDGRVLRVASKGYLYSAGDDDFRVLQPAGVVIGKVADEAAQ